VKRAGALASLAVLLATQAAWADGTATPPASTPAPAPAETPASTPPTATGPEGPKRPVIEDPAGTPVTFDSSDYAMRVYLAKGDVRDNAIPDPFEKLPKLPCTVRLAPGTYTAEAESPNASTGHQRFVVEHDAPIKVVVHSGNASVKAFGAVFIGVGIVSTILGIVSIISISPNDSSFNRWAVGLPLTLGGIGVGGLGIGMTFLGTTEIDAPHPPPGGRVKSVALSWKF
jgi:hypothetical protein